MVEVIPVPRCPKCGYMLAFLDKMRKYRCSKCDSIYLEREIDAIEFNKWNQRQNLADRKALKIKPRIRSKEYEQIVIEKNAQKRLDEY